MNAENEVAFLFNGKEEIHSKGARDRERDRAKEKKKRKREREIDKETKCQKEPS